MPKYYFYIKATNSEHVEEVDALDKDKALEKLIAIYAPVSPITGDKHSGVQITMISADNYLAEYTRIIESRKSEAETSLVQ